MDEEEYSKVSLGFAEFVSQLLHETFDAALSAQNYQLEKYLELEKALSLSIDQFKELYLDEDQIHEEEIEIFGVSVVKDMEVTGDLLSIINESVEDFNKGKEEIVHQGKLTKKGVTLLKQIVLEKLVEERKRNLRELINKTEMVRLMVDSGEIRVKLELSNLSQVTKTEESKEDKTKRKGTSSEKPISYEKLKSKIIGVRGIKTREILDPDTKRRILVIDKDSIDNKADVKSSIPNVRLIATPAQVTSSSNLYSEVIIKFKTI